MTPRLPDFVLIGTAKAGTTALHALLAQHRDVFLSDPKEPHFFAYEGHALDFAGPGDQRMMRHMTVTDLGAYQALFAGRHEHAVGEASAMYLYVDGTAERMHHYVPNAQLLVVLREPAARAYSAFQHLRRDGREPIEDFRLALAAEPKRIRDGWLPLWHYRAMGLYAGQLERYLRLFPEDRVHVILHEELRADPAAVVAAIFRTLGVDDRAVIDTTLDRNVSGIARNAAAQRALMRPHPIKDLLKPLIPSGFRERLLANLKRANLRQGPPMPADVDVELRSYYAQDVERLAKLIDRDLSGWLP